MNTKLYMIEGNEDKGSDHFVTLFVIADSYEDAFNTYREGVVSKDFADIAVEYISEVPMKAMINRSKRVINWSNVKYIQLNSQLSKKGEFRIDKDYSRNEDM